MSTLNGLVGKYLVFYSSLSSYLYGIYLVEEVLENNLVIANKFDHESTPLSFVDGLLHLVDVKYDIEDRDCAILDNANDVALMVAKLKKIKEVMEASKKFLLSDLLPKNIALGLNDGVSDPAVGD